MLYVHSGKHQILLTACLLFLSRLWAGLEILSSLVRSKSVPETLGLRSRLLLLYLLFRQNDYDWRKW